MAQNGEEHRDVLSSPSASGGFIGKIEDQYKKLKEHAEAYPYVWGSYIVVYGGLGLWMTYRWRRLRNTEDRVRVLQERLRKLYEAEEAAATKSNPPPKGQ